MILGIVLATIHLAPPHSVMGWGAIAASEALYFAAYWFPRHTLFSTLLSHKSEGRSVSYATVLTLAAGVLGPIIAASLSGLPGGTSLCLMVAAFVLLGSTFPLIGFPQCDKLTPYSFKEALSVIKDPTIRALAPVYLGSALLEMLFQLPWVLIFTLFIGSVAQLGIVAACSAFFAGIGSLILGRIFDRGTRIKALRSVVTVRMVSLSLYSLLFFLPLPLLAAFIDAITKVAATLQNTVTDSYFFTLSRRIHPSDFALNQELYINPARVLVSGALGVLFLYVPTSALWIILACAPLAQFCYFAFRHAEGLIESSSVAGKSEAVTKEVIEEELIELR